MLNYLVEKHQSILTVIFVLLISWSLAGTTNSLIVASLDLGGPEKGIKDGSQLALSRFRRQRKDLTNYEVITERNIFDSLHRKPPEAKQNPGLQDDPVFKGGPATKSSIKAQLLGTMVFGNAKFSFASVKELSGDKETKNFYIGDKVLGKARVTRVERNRIYIVHNNRNEYLEVQDAAAMTGPPTMPGRGKSSAPVGSTIRRDGNRITIDAREVDSALQNMSTIAMQARVVPNFINGQVNGFKIFAIKPNSIYQKLGIRNGDVIQKINDFEINSPEKALQVYTQLRNEKSINIDLTRRGKKQTLQVEVR